MKILNTTFLFFFVSQLSAQIPTSGLVGGWTFSGNATDISGSNNNGTVTAAVLTTDRCGNSNSAYYFNGSNAEIVMGAPGPTSTSPRSVAFWAKTSMSQTLMAIIGWGSPFGGQSFSIQYNYNCDGVGADVNNQAYTMGSSCINNDVWHHVVAIFNPSISPNFGDMEFYVNGIKLPGITCIISGTTQAINTGAQFPVTVGRVNDDLARYFTGSIDDIYIYNRVLSPNEVVQIYNTPCQSPPKTICKGTVQSFSLAPVVGATSYSWSVPTTWQGSSATNTLVATVNSSGTVIATATGTCGMISRCATVVTMKECNVGINENEFDQNRSIIFPNPGQGHYILKSAPGNTLFIHDVVGNLLSTEIIKSVESEIDLSRFADGLYFFKIISPSGERSIKVIKE